MLTALAALLLIIFGDITDRLIPFFAVGAFLAFTLSQAGMVVHWQRTGGVRAWRNMVINGAGAVATGVTLLREDKSMDWTALVIDDDHGIRQSLRLCLAVSGTQVLRCSSELT